MQTHPLRVVALTAACLVSSAVTAPAADQLLRGTVASAAGEKLGGVTVSAKAHGSTITTSVYTDEQGGYYFPPLPAATYTVWAQALAFELAKGEVDLTAVRRGGVHPHPRDARPPPGRRADLTLNAMTDAERQVRQLPGEMLMAALPEDSAADARIKRVFRNACTGCHTPSYVLQFRFDETGWNAIIELMKRVNVAGVYQGPDSKPST